MYVMCSESFWLLMNDILSRAMHSFSSGESSEPPRWNAEIAFVIMPRHWHAAYLEQ